MPKISSRLGNNKVVFKPYTAEQLKKIVHARLDDARLMKSSTVGLGGLSGPPETTSEPLRKNVVEEKNDSAFEAVAVELASRKVAAVSGDARRVLELCRRAAELAETLAGRSFDEAENVHAYDGDLSAADVAELDRRRRRVAALDKAQVVMQHIKAAMFEMFQSPHMRMLEAASRHDRIFLCALLLELRASGVTEARVSNVMRRHVQLCRAHAEPEPPAGAAVSIACRLASSGLLLADPGRRRAAQRVCLNVPMEDVAYALKDERRLQERKLAAHEALRRATGGRPSEKNTNGVVASAAANAALAAQTEADRGDIPWIRQMDL
jgi:origin recognition complex subunit 1